MMMVHPGQKIVVWFSCGAASAVAAKKTIDRYGATNPIRVVNTPMAEEDSDNRRFLADVEKWLGTPIELATAARWPASSADELWRHERFMAGVFGAACTRGIKKAARFEWEVRNPTDWMVLGFTADEQDRHDRFVRSERENVLPVLIEERLTKADCFMLLDAAGIALPRVYAQGYPNANCIGCVKAASPTYWNLVREQHPAVFAERAALSRELGVRLAKLKGERVFLDELPANAKGRPLKNMQIECGIFCPGEPMPRLTPNPQEPK